MATKSAATAAAAKTDATILLTRDHTEVHKLFKQYEKLADAQAAASDRQALAEEICMKLTIHATSEEEMFPKCRKSPMDLADLAARLAERKAQLLAEAAEEVIA